MEWQSIETAPQDGTWILAINGKSNCTRQHVVHYSTRYTDEFHWVTSSAPMDFVSGLTHWMPLPEAPNVELRGDASRRPVERSETNLSAGLGAVYYGE